MHASFKGWSRPAVWTGMSALTKTAGFVGGLQLAGDGVGVRRIFQIQPDQPFNRLLAARAKDILIGGIDLMRRTTSEMVTPSSWANSSSRRRCSPFSRTPNRFVISSFPYGATCTDIVVCQWHKPYRECALFERVRS